MAAGFGAANVLLLRALGPTGTSAAQPGGVRVTGEPEPPPGPPAMAGAAPAPPATHVFDRVIVGGRVIDPDTGYDAVANVGIDGNQITSISTDPLNGRASIDAKGLVVSPGFIDILSYEPIPHGVWFKVADGVTTNLCMHGINNTAQGFFGFFGRDDQRPPVNYGGAFDDPFIRSEILDIPNRAATADQRAQLEAAFEEGIHDGWLGVDVEPEYTPYVTAEEITGLGSVAARYGLPLFSHIRYSSPTPADQSSLVAIDELLKVATDTGVAVHIDHITSMATHVMEPAIAKVDEARRQGLAVTACLYPYDFWATTLASERFAPGWQQRFGITYDDLEIPGTDERITESNFERLRADNVLVAAHAIPEADVRAALLAPWTMIGSDAILEPGNNNHPRSTGCFTRTLGRYVRDEGVLTLPEALSKMTIQPARCLEGRSSAMTRKGRLQMGADADITVFNPDTVGDRSTISNPAQAAVGVEYVLVGGQLVKERDVLHKDVTPGQPVKPDV